MLTADGEAGDTLLRIFSLNTLSLIFGTRVVFALLNHAPEAAVAGADKADIEVEGSAEVLLGEDFIA